MRPAACRALICLCIVTSTSAWVAANTDAAETGDDSETKAERDARMAWWREARFGMFIHWGVYSVPAGEYKGQRFDHIGEWLMLDAKIPVDEYRAYARQFNPVKYDPQQWARLARDAGMKYIVITAKHHDGFALFPSDATDWNIADASPYGRDLIGPLAEAARDEGLKFGLYYSQAQDWVHPGGGKAHGYKSHRGWDEAHNGDFDEYLHRIAVPQVREILARYKPDILWWDTPVEMTRERAELFAPLLRQRPGIITNDRLQRPDFKGDFGTPEQEIPDTGLDRDWETCMTMNRTWGYKSYDHDWKPADKLLLNLIEAASKGGNYLLNIGPKPDGTIPKESIERLQAIGQWMKVNGESIYGSTASPVERPDWGLITTKQDAGVTKLYLHVLAWPTNGRLPVAISNEVKDCRLLADSGRSFDVDGDEAGGLVVNMTGSPPDEVASVVVLTIEGTPGPVVKSSTSGVHEALKNTPAAGR